MNVCNRAIPGLVIVRFLAYSDVRDVIAFSMVCRSAYVTLITGNTPFARVLWTVQFARLQQEQHFPPHSISVQTLPIAHLMAFCTRARRIEHLVKRKRPISSVTIPLKLGYMLHPPPNSEDEEISDSPDGPSPPEDVGRTLFTEDDRFFPDPFSGASYLCPGGRWLIGCRGDPELLGLFVWDLHRPITLTEEENKPELLNAAAILCRGRWASTEIQMLCTAGKGSFPPVVVILRYTDGEDPRRMIYEAFEIYWRPHDPNAAPLIVWRGLIRPHETGKRSWVLDGDMVGVSYNNPNVMLWNWRTGHLVSTTLAAPNNVKWEHDSIKMHDSHIFHISQSPDWKIRIWKFDPLNLGAYYTYATVPVATIDIFTPNLKGWEITIEGSLPATPWFPNRPGQPLLFTLIANAAKRARKLPTDKTATVALTLNESYQSRLSAPIRIGIQSDVRGTWNTSMNTLTWIEKKMELTGNAKFAVLPIQVFDLNSSAVHQSTIPTDMNLHEWGVDVFSRRGTRTMYVESFDPHSGAMLISQPRDEDYEFFIIRVV